MTWRAGVEVRAVIKKTFPEPGAQCSPGPKELMGVGTLPPSAPVIGAGMLGLAGWLTILWRRGCWET